MDIIPSLIKIAKVYAYRCNDYWVDISTLEAYWKANMDLLGDGQAYSLIDPAWTLQYLSDSTVPMNVRPSGVVKNSLVSEGCIIAGEVEHSVLSPRVQIEKGAIVRDSVIMNGAVIHSGAMINQCVVDNFAEIKANTQIGVSADQTVAHLGSRVRSKCISLLSTVYGCMIRLIAEVKRPAEKRWAFCV